MNKPQLLQPSGCLWVFQGATPQAACDHKQQWGRKIKKNCGFNRIHVVKLCHFALICLGYFKSSAPQPQSPDLKIVNSTFSSSRPVLAKFAPRTLTPISFSFSCTTTILLSSIQHQCTTSLIAQDRCFALVV